MSDYDDEDFYNVPMDSSDDEGETIRCAYQDATSALLSEEPNVLACFRRVLKMEEKKGSKTVWGFKALKHLVVASIQANDVDAAANRYAQLLGYGGVVSSAVMESAIAKIAVLAHDPRVTLRLCQVTYNVRKPTMTWLAHCMKLLSEVRHTHVPAILVAALESASELRRIISNAAHLDEAKQSHLLSIDAIAAELWFRKREFEEVYIKYIQLEAKLPTTNPLAFANIYEVFAKTLLSPTCTLQLDGPRSLAAECLEKALALYPSADTEAHVRCLRYLAVNHALRGTTRSSSAATPDAFKSRINPVVRLVTLFVDDHGDRFLAAWEQGRTELGDPFLQEFFDACAGTVRWFRAEFHRWTHAFEQDLDSDSVRLSLSGLCRLRNDTMSNGPLGKYEAVRDARSLMISVAEIDIFKAEGKVHRVEASIKDANLRAQKINSQAAAIVCELSGHIRMRRGHLNYAREELSRAFTLFADKDPDRRRACAMLLAFCNYFQVCRLKYRLEADVETSLSHGENENLQEFAAALRTADAVGFARLLQKNDLMLGTFMRELLASLSTELTDATGKMEQARGLRASGDKDAVCTLVEDLYRTCNGMGLWFDAILVQMGALVATASPELGRRLSYVREEGRKSENCQVDTVPGVSTIHDSLGRDRLMRGKFDSAGRHFETALRAYESNATATGFFGASFLALSTLMNGETSGFDEAIARFGQWLTDAAQAALRRFHDAYKSQNIVAVDAAVTRLKESDHELASVAEYYASVLRNKLNLRQLTPPLAWKLVFDRLSHHDLHDVQLACRSFRCIVRPLIRHAPLGAITISAQLGPWRHVWAVQSWPHSSPTGWAAGVTVELVDRLEEAGGPAPIPKLVIRGDAALDHPQLLEYVARHEVVDLVLETDLSGTPRSLEVIRSAISQDFLRRLVQACPPSDAQSEADLTIYASPNDSLRQLNWNEYLDHRKTTDASGATYEFAANGVAIEVKISLNEHCRLKELGPAREYDVLRVSRRRIDG